MDLNIENVSSNPNLSPTEPLQTSPEIKPRTSKLPMILVLTLVILLLGGIAGSFAIAYGKISIGNPAIESSLTRLVLSLPFTPKTPKYLLESSALAHKKVSKHALEISIAADAGGLSQYLGMTSLDGLIKGSVDYTDPKNPRLTLNASLTKDLNFDIRKNDKFIYFKINKLPVTLLMPILGLTETSSFDQALDKWIVYDSSTLDTQARKLLESENKQNSSYTNKFITDTVDKFLDKELLKEIKVESVTEEGTQTYELSLSPSGETLDYLADKMRDQKSKTSTYYQATKPSDYIKDLKINLWLDKQSYLVRKLSVVFRLYTPTSSSALTPSFTDLPGLPFGKQEMPVSLVLKLSDFGKDFKVETPTSALKPEEYIKIIVGQSEKLQERTASALDSRRQSDLRSIQSALEMCYIDKAKYVGSLDELIACGVITKIPIDPVSEKPYTYSVNKQKTGYVLKATLSNGEGYSVSNPQ